MKRLIILPLLLLTGCASSPLMGTLGLGGVGKADVWCTLDGEAMLVQAVGPVTSTQRLEKVDRVCKEAWAAKPAS